MAAVSLRRISAVLALCFFASSAFAQSEARTPSGALPDGTIGGDVTLDDLDVGAVEMFALTPADPPDAPRAMPRPRYLATAHGDYQFDTDLDTAGDFSVARFRTGIGVAAPLSERLGVNAAASYQFSSYDFDNAAGLGGGGPWDDIHISNIMAVFNYAIDQRWSAFGGPMLSVAGESGAGFSDSATGGAMLGVGYRVSDRLVVRVGVAASSELDEDASVLPTFVVEYAIDEHWQLRGGGIDLGASSGVGLTLNHRIDERWSVGGHIGFLQQRFRLDDSGVAPDGVGENQRSAVALGLTWTPRPNLQVGFQLGAQFDGELRVDDEDGHTLFTEDYDSGVFAGASVVLRF